MSSKDERAEERFEHQKRVSKITDPMFKSLEKRLLEYLGYITHQYCSGGPFPNQRYTGQMDGLSSALRIVEHEFVDAMEAEKKPQETEKP